MTENKTKVNNNSVDAFIESVENEQRKKDSITLLKFFKDHTGLEAKMWGPSIIGFGSYHYVYDSGREGDMLLTGFSPRKNALTIYILAGFSNYEKLLSKLGKHKTGKSCLYIKHLDDINMDVLKSLISESMAFIKEKYPD